MNNPLYYAKILLFGEYGIIEDSMGLSIPYTFFKGQLGMGAHLNEEQKASNESIRQYAMELSRWSREGRLPAGMDVDALESDVRNGLYFESSIPQGFGVGSSGALVAALYERYAKSKHGSDSVMEDGKLAELKQDLALLESYFHGKSSGLDPLICYLNLPILIKGQGDLDAVGLPSENSEGQGAIFLMDSGSPGKTQGMVAIFLQKLKDEGFRHMVRTQLKKYNDACVQAFLKGETGSLLDNVKSLSSLFLDNFKPMIPARFEHVWKQGLETNAYYLKLCGSGGGGFVLGFTHDWKKAQELLKGHNLQVIYKI
ncbi:MAG: mevalonate kinase [Bacteroidia bacterium]